MLVAALADAWRDWKVQVVPTLGDARQALQAGAADVVLASQRLSDGSVFDILPFLKGLPAIILVPAGAEMDAAHAMRHGFADFVVRDPLGMFLLTLPAQIEAVLELSSSARSQRMAQELLARQHQLLQAISRAQAGFIARQPARDILHTLLRDLMELTQSGLGILAQCRPALEPEAAGMPALVMARWMPDEHQGLQFTICPPSEPVPPGLQARMQELQACGCVVVAPPHAAEDGAELPGFLGLPIEADGEQVALLGLAGRPGGYVDADVQFLQPLLNTVGHLEQARRAQQVQDAVKAQLARTSDLLAEKTRALELTLGSVAQGITNVDGQGRIRVYNRRYLELLDLPESLLATQPRVEDVVRFQTARGDFGPDFSLIAPDARSYVAAEYAAQGPGLNMPESYVRRTPAGRYIEVRSRMLQGGGRVRTFTDVTDYLTALEALRDSEARWRSLTQLSSDWYWEQDAEFRFVRFDGGSTKLKLRHGTLADEAHYGLTRWELPNAEVDERLWAAHRAQLEAHEVFHDFEMKRISDDGQPVWVSVSGEPIFDSEGHFTGYRGVARNITERKLAEAEIERLAFYDELTGLPNRRLLLDRLDRAAKASARSGQHGALLFLDLDNFKGINDTLGHEWGDRLLYQVGARLHENTRANDTVARLGGDEFVVVLQGLNAAEPLAASEAENVGLKLLGLLNQPYDLDGQELHITPSIGITLFNDASTPVHELLQRADLAMYQAKSEGRNTLCFFDPAMQAAATARSALEGDIRQGLQRGEFLLHYQPVVDADGQALGGEALVRWQHPQRGMVSPAEFIPVAEQSGLILPLGQQVLRMACTQLAQWALQPVSSHWMLAVNVSAQEFRHSDYVHQVLQTLAETGANPQRLRLELTESLLLKDVEDCITKMQALREHGIGFSLDDFGTGYSSLSYLKRLPLDLLKIDQSFVRDVLTDPNDATIACTIITLAQSLGLEVVAEGVETEGQLTFLLAHGCRRFQGYLFGRPGPAEALERTP